MAAHRVELFSLPLEERDAELSLLDLARLDDSDPPAVSFLTSNERAEYGWLRHAGRRREWLGARACLKAMLLGLGAIREPTQCEIVKSAGGRPRLQFPPGFPLTPVHDCSLSHKAAMACGCVSSRPNSRVGVDVEQPSSRLARLAAAFVHPRDRLIRSRPAEIELAILWTLKEACAKAVGTGIWIGLESVICRETAAGRHRLTIEGGPEFQGRHFLYNGYVVALALTESKTQIRFDRITKPSTRRRPERAKAAQ